MTREKEPTEPAPRPVFESRGGTGRTGENSANKAAATLSPRGRERKPPIKVRTLMKRHVWTCRPGDSLSEAAAILWIHDCGCVPVIDIDSRVVGIITDRDICMGSLFRGEPLHSIRVSAAMSTGVKTCLPEETIEFAEGIMRSNQVRRLPVVDREGHAIGILSLNDLACNAAVLDGHVSRGVSSEQVGLTLAAVSAPRSKPKDDPHR